MALNVKCINNSGYPLPQYATPMSAGCDLRAVIDESVTLKPLERHLFPTGIYIQLPQGYEAQVRPRSGLAAKYGITVLNTPGTIDADYTGQVHACLINLSNVDFIVNPGDRIAQMVIAKHETADFCLVEQLEETERGDGGHGHTGIK